MAANLTENDKKNLYTVALDVFSKYDIGHPAVKKFLQNIADVVEVNQGELKRAGSKKKNQVEQKDRDISQSIREPRVVSLSSKTIKELVNALSTENKNFKQSVVEQVAERSVKRNDKEKSEFVKDIEKLQKTISILKNIKDTFNESFIKKEGTGKTDVKENIGTVSKIKGFYDSLQKQNLTQIRASNSQTDRQEKSKSENVVNALEKIKNFLAKIQTDSQDTPNSAQADSQGSSQELDLIRTKAKKESDTSVKNFKQQTEFFNKKQSAFQVTPNSSGADIQGSSQELDLIREEPKEPDKDFKDKVLEKLDKLSKIDYCCEDSKKKTGAPVGAPVGIPFGSPKSVPESNRQQKPERISDVNSPSLFKILLTGLAAAGVGEVLRRILTKPEPVQTPKPIKAPKPVEVPVPKVPVEVPVPKVPVEVPVPKVPVEVPVPKVPVEVPVPKVPVEVPVPKAPTPKAPVSPKPTVPPMTVPVPHLPVPAPGVPGVLVTAGSPGAGEVVARKGTRLPFSTTPQYLPEPPVGKFLNFPRSSAGGTPNFFGGPPTTNTPYDPNVKYWNGEPSSTTPTSPPKTTTTTPEAPKLVQVQTPPLESSRPTTPGTSSSPELKSGSKAPVVTGATPLLENLGSTATKALKYAEPVIAPVVKTAKVISPFVAPALVTYEQYGEYAQQAQAIDEKIAKGELTKEQGDFEKKKLLGKVSGRGVAKLATGTGGAWAGAAALGAAVAPLTVPMAATGAGALPAAVIQGGAMIAGGVAGWWGGNALGEATGAHDLVGKGGEFIAEKVSDKPVEVAVKPEPVEVVTPEPVEVVTPGPIKAIEPESNSSLLTSPKLPLATALTPESIGPVGRSNILTPTLNKSNTTSDIASVDGIKNILSETSSVLNTIQLGKSDNVIADSSDKNITKNVVTSDSETSNKERLELLKSISVNSKETNSSIDNLARALFEFLKISQNNSTPSVVMMPQQAAPSPKPQGKSAPQIASSNIDPVRLVRSRFNI